MRDAAAPTTADGYIRVSRRAGREGENFISPDVQRKKIAEWARLHGVEIVRWWEEIDQSGAKLARPMFQDALARCEREETGGIVVARLDRFARSAVDALESIKRLNQSQARLVSVEDNFDGSTPMGRFAIGILTLIAELELERIKSNWTTAVTEAIGRGVYISARPPTGYRRDEETGRLVRAEPAASVMAEVFRRRATGASYTDLARFLEAQGVYPNTGNKHWSATGVTSLLRNPAYLGHARQGKITNKTAHEPLVTRAEWDAAQSSRTVLRPKSGTSVSAMALLGGLIRCAGCGHTLKIAGGRPRGGNPAYPTYYCSGRYAKGLCPSRATIRASIVDDYVEDQVLTALRADGGPLAQAVQAGEKLESAARAVQDAEHELDLYITNPQLLTLLGEARFLEGAEARQHALDDTRSALAHLQAHQQLAADLTDGRLLDAWPTLGTPDKRRLLHGLLDRVILKRADARRENVPIQHRTQIILRGNVLLESDAHPSTPSIGPPEG
jgi:DNA invertase Pin-like site-specific DNA recombinase